jgi:hypothetical protein
MFLLVNLIVDTGSSNTWVGANLTNPFVDSKTTKELGQLAVRVSCYLNGSYRLTRLIPVSL